MIKLFFQSCLARLASAREEQRNESNGGVVAKAKITHAQCNDKISQSSLSKITYIYNIKALWSITTLDSINISIHISDRTSASSRLSWTYETRNLKTKFCLNWWHYLKPDKNCWTWRFWFIYGSFRNSGTPKSWISIGFSIVNHPFGVPLFLETPIYFMHYLPTWRAKTNHTHHWFKGNRFKKTPGRGRPMRSSMAKEASDLGRHDHARKDMFIQRIFLRMCSRECWMTLCW